MAASNENVLEGRVEGLRKTAAVWENENPVLRYGEFVSVVMPDGSIRHKTGDGVAAYADLPFDDEQYENETPFEAMLQWGGKDIAGDVSPLDASLIDEMSPNRLAFLPASCIKVEYTRDGGSTWTDYGLTDDEKRSFVTLSQDLTIGCPDSDTTVTTDCKVRVTITATAGVLYFQTRKIAIYMTTRSAKGTHVLIEHARCGSGDVFHTTKQVELGGRPGWNIVQLAERFGGSESQTTNLRSLRFTFGVTSTPTGATSTMMVSKLYMYGETVWYAPYSMMKTGRPYTYDVNQNVTFPAKVSAAGFVGALSSAAPTENADHMLDGAGYYQAYAAINGINYSFGIFYWDGKSTTYVPGAYDYKIWVMGTGGVFVYDANLSTPTHTLYTAKIG